MLLPARLSYSYLFPYPEQFSRMADQYSLQEFCLIFLLYAELCSATISISVACPWAPPDGWWIIISEFGRARRFPFAPPAEGMLPYWLPYPYKLWIRRTLQTAWCHKSTSRRWLPRRRVNVQVNVFFRVFRFQKQHLRHDQVCHVVFDLAGQKNDAFLKQTGVDIKRTFTALRSVQWPSAPGPYGVQSCLVRHCMTFPSPGVILKYLLHWL